MVERAEEDQQQQRPLKGEKQYRDFLLQSLGVTSLLVFLLVCWITSLPTFLAEDLAMTTEEVEMFATPGARLLAKANLPDRVKSTLVNSGDYIGLGTACTVYVYRVLETMRQFQGRTVNEHSGQGQGLPAASLNNQSAGNNGYSATVNAGQLAGWGNFGADR